MNKVYPGARIGRWTVMECEANAENGCHTSKSTRKWLCRCDCGTERFVLERSLQQGNSYSCGCARRENAHKAIAHNIAGKTFGQLTALQVAKNQPKNGGIWWTCACSCGNHCDVPASLLVQGRKTHCGCRTRREFFHKDIAGQRFERLMALYPTKQRKKGSVIWHCRCDCGKEIDVSYNELVYSNLQSCGCKKKEHDDKLADYLTHIAGTSLDVIKSKKIPTNNTTGVKGVYLIRGKWVAKIVFQKKAYYLGTFTEFKDAVSARKEAEELLNAGTVAYYTKWKAKADIDPVWGKENPIKISVEKSTDKGISITFLPMMEE